MRKHPKHLKIYMFSNRLTQVEAQHDGCTDTEGLSLIADTLNRFPEMVCS